MTTAKAQTTPISSASTAAQRRADALYEAAIITEANGSYHKVKNHTRRFAGKLIRKYGFDSTNDLINGAYRMSDLRLEIHGSLRYGNRNYHVERDYRDFLKSLRRSCKSLRKAHLRRLLKRQQNGLTRCSQKKGGGYA